MALEQLKLENQFCFPVYAASRLIIRAYQPFLDKLKITYPQYLVLMILWETESVAVNDIAKRLILQTNTVTPLLKRMEKQGLLVRERSEKDERKVIVRLTDKGKDMEENASEIPESLLSLLEKEHFDLNDLMNLKIGLNHVIDTLMKQKI